MNPLRALAEKGQAVWLDLLSREIIQNGHLQQLIDRDGLAGITSNPSIFEKAIGETGTYDSEIARMVGENGASVSTIYERLTTADIAAAADMLRPLYDRTEGRHGFVSLEVSPYLATDTAARSNEARRLWAAVGAAEYLHQGAGHQARYSGDSSTARRRAQHQHHAVVLAKPLR